MEWLYTIIGYPLGWIMWLAYKVIPNFGLALILFTLIIRVLMIPLSIKQQKSTVRMKMIQPKMAEIQKKYANNREKMNQEMMDLYARENYSPTAGCLPMVIQLPILFGLIDVIYKPMTHILRMSDEIITTITQLGLDMGVLTNAKDYSRQITMVGAIQNNPEAFSALSADTLEQISRIDLSFLGLYLGDKPTLALNWLIIIPILAGVTSFLTSWITMKVTAGGAMDSQTAGMNRSMMIMMPLMSLWFTFQVPAGVGFYWIVSNVVMLAQSLILNKVYNPAEMAAAMELAEAERKEQERQEKIEARRLLKEQGNEAAAAALSQKEIDRQKLAAARRRDAERYGDYTDMGDLDDEDEPKSKKKK